MKKKILVCGSYAFDHIMVFHDRFKHHILPDKVHLLNVSFMVPTMRKEFGGCGGNISYNLKLLGANVVPMATVGADFGAYQNWLVKNKIDTTYIKIIDGAYTGQAFITTDLDDNQITAFHPGAMNFSHQNRVEDVKGVHIGIISPDGRLGMLEHAAAFSRLNIPFLFDPGQALPLFNRAELVNFVEQARWVAMNDYESHMLQEKSKMSLAQIARMVEAMIITKGAAGSEIWTNGAMMKIPALAARTVKDPTGSGDAYRAGLLFGIMHDFDWRKTARLATILGAIKVAHLGTQNHRFDLENIGEIYAENFGEEF